MKNAHISDLIGKTLKKIDIANYEIEFTCDDDSKYQMSHDQDCCENVSVEDVVGDINDLIGSPILKASEDTNNENPEGIKKESQDSFTWTFYNLATIKGHVTIRWYGESNGYYSEDVSFYKL